MTRGKARVIRLVYHKGGSFVSILHVTPHVLISFFFPLSLLLPLFPSLLFLSIHRHFSPTSLSLFLEFRYLLCVAHVYSSWRALSEDQAHYTSKYVYKKSILTSGAALLMDCARHFFLNISMRVMFLFSCDCTCIGCLKLRGKRREGRGRRIKMQFFFLFFFFVNLVVGCEKIQKTKTLLQKNLFMNGVSNHEE